MFQFQNSISIGDIISILLLCSATAGIFLTIRQVSQSERSLRFNVYYQAIEMLEKTRAARHLLYEKIPKDASNFNFGDLNKEEMEQLDELARTYDKLGLLVKHKVIPLNFILDFYSRPIILTWSRLEPYIIAERKKRMQPAHMKMFQLLAINVLKHSTEDIGGETFTGSAEEASNLKVWRR
jgi:hypothetical protein